jgi:hypothetical protein
LRNGNGEASRTVEEEIEEARRTGALGLFLVGTI